MVVRRRARPVESRTYERCTRMDNGRSRAGAVPAASPSPRTEARFDARAGRVLHGHRTHLGLAETAARGAWGTVPAGHALCVCPEPRVPAGSVCELWRGHAVGGHPAAVHVARRFFRGEEAVLVVPAGECRRVDLPAGDAGDFAGERFDRAVAAFRERAAQRRELHHVSGTDAEPERADFRVPGGGPGTGERVVFFWRRRNAAGKRTSTWRLCR